MTERPWTHEDDVRNEEPPCEWGHTPADCTCEEPRVCRECGASSPCIRCRAFGTRHLRSVP